MKRVRARMTHNDRFFFSLFCVGLSQGLALCALQHERAISQLQVASENSLLCAFQFHTRCWSFSFFFFLSSFMSCHCFFFFFSGQFYVLPLFFFFLRLYKSQKVSVSRAGSQRDRIRRRKVDFETVFESF